MYKCVNSFTSLMGKHYNNRDKASYNEVYSLESTERNNFRDIADEDDNILPDTSIFLPLIDSFTSDSSSSGIDTSSDSGTDFGGGDFGGDGAGGEW